MAVASQHQDAPLLSIVVIGRNDSYMGNFQYRLTTALNSLARKIGQLGYLDRVEILLTDWNSDVPLSRTLTLMPETARVLRFLYVPPAVACQIQRPDETFLAAHATNVALRRAQGQFIMLFDADCLISQYSLQRLLELLDGKLRVPYKVDQVYFFCGRYQVPWELVQRQPSLDEWDRYLTLNSGQLPPDPRSLGLGVFGIALTMHRSLWHACRGYDESQRGWGWLDAELTLRITQRYPWIDLASLGVSVFHMEHRQLKRRVIGSPVTLNRHDVGIEFAANDENWGLGSTVLEIQRVENTDASPQATPIAIVAWPKTRVEIVSELTASSLRQHLWEIVTARSVKPHEWGSLYALAWYSLYHYPRNYLEFGIRYAHAAAVVSAACTGVEIYGVESWQPLGDSQPTPPPSYSNVILQSVGYRGYLRYVSGDIQTAFERLCTSFVGQPIFDLIFVRGDLFGANALEQICNLVPHLAPGGMLLLTCASLETFGPLWSELQAQYPELTYIQCSELQTGLALAVSLRDDNAQQDGSLANEAPRLVGAWRSIQFGRADLKLWQRRFRSIWDLVRYQSVWQWPKTLRSRWLDFRQRWQRTPSSSSH